MTSRSHRKGFFLLLADRISSFTGRPLAFLLALTVVLVWAISGPLVHFTQSWQLAIDTTTSIITFLMVFLIQNLQNRDTKALHLKLDELIRATAGAHTSLLGLHDLNEEQLKELSEKYRKIAVDAKNAIREGGDDTGIAEVEMLVEEIIEEEEKEKKKGA